MGNYLMGIDIGTSACKVAVFGEDRLITSTSAPYRVYYPHPGWVEQHADEWWQGVCSAINEIFSKGISPSDIAAVGIDGQSWSAIAMDQEGCVLAPNPIWMDTRSASLCKEVGHQIGEDAIFKVSGNPFSPSYTLPKVLYWKKHHPEILKKASKILQSNSFIAYKLTGSISQDYSQCYGWHNFDQNTLRYDAAMTREFGIPESLLVDPVPCDAIVGRVTAKASAECGLLIGTPVVAGGLDAACATLGAGVIAQGQTQEQGGQAGGMSICLDKPLAHPQLILSAHVVPGRWLLQGGSVGGGILNWFNTQLGAAERDNARSCNCSSYEIMSNEASGIAPGSDGLVFLPYMSGERSPIWDSNACGTYFGLGYDKTRAHMIRSAMEGVAYSLMHNLETAGEVDAEVSELRAVGGAANSIVWTQIKADVTGKRIVVPSSDNATTLGAAILAGMGTGCFDSYPSAVARYVNIEREQSPDIKAVKRYVPYYKLYKDLYLQLKQSMEELSRIKGICE